MIPFSSISVSTDTHTLYGTVFITYSHSREVKVWRVGVFPLSHQTYLCTHVWVGVFQFTIHAQYCAIIALSIDLLRGFIGGWAGNKRSRSQGHGLGTCNSRLLATSATSQQGQDNANDQQINSCDFIGYAPSTSRVVSGQGVQIDDDAVWSAGQRKLLTANNAHTHARTRGMVYARNQYYDGPVWVANDAPVALFITQFPEPNSLAYATGSLEQRVTGSGINWFIVKIKF